MRRDGADQGRAEELRAAELGGALVAELATQQRREDAPLGAWRGPEVLAVAGAREHDQVRRFGPRIVEPVGPEREAYHGTRRREARELGMRPTTLLRMWVLERIREAARQQAPVRNGGAERV